jgi:hypothetical protein
MEMRSVVHGHILLEQHDALANPKVWPVVPESPQGRFPVREYYQNA